MAEGQTILGGDLDVSLIHRRLEGDERTFLQDQGRLSEIAEMRAMVRRPDTSDQTLVELGRVEQVLGGGHEVVRALSALEAEHVGAEEALDDLAPPWQPLEQFERRERNVVEPPDPDVVAEFAQQPGDEL